MAHPDRKTTQILPSPSELDDRVVAILWAQKIHNLTLQDWLCSFQRLFNHCAGVHFFTMFM
ncbi:hypothetical protein ASE31_22605 [Acidovorax sp. Root217]|nr:hypothetical protein ASE31_22605 [Acidovorax sp. Root217]